MTTPAEAPAKLFVGDAPAAGPLVDERALELGDGQARETRDRRVTDPPSRAGASISVNDDPTNGYHPRCPLQHLPSTRNVPHGNVRPGSVEHE